MLGWDPDPDKPGCITTCWGGKVTHIFCMFFSGFLSPTQLTGCRVIWSVVGSSPVEQPHKMIVEFGNCLLKLIDS